MFCPTNGGFKTFFITQGKKNKKNKTKTHQYKSRSALVLEALRCSARGLKGAGCRGPLLHPIRTFVARCCLSRYGSHVLFTLGCLLAM